MENLLKILVIIAFLTPVMGFNMAFYANRSDIEPMFWLITKIMMIVFGLFSTIMATQCVCSWQFTCPNRIIDNIMCFSFQRIFQSHFFEEKFTFYGLIKASFAYFAFLALIVLLLIIFAFFTLLITFNSCFAFYTLTITFCASLTLGTLLINFVTRFAPRLQSIFSDSVSVKFRDRLKFFTFGTVLCYDWFRHGLVSLSERLCSEPVTGHTAIGSHYFNRRYLMVTSLIFILSTICFAQEGLVYHYVNVVNELNQEVDVTQVEIYKPGTTSYATIYKERNIFPITQPMTTSSTNTTISGGRFTWWGPDGWDYKITTSTHIQSSEELLTLNASDNLVVLNIAVDSDLYALAANDYTADIHVLNITTKGPWVDVRAYGADPTGVADSTAAFHTAIDAAGTTKEVYVPSGNYLITDSLPKIRYVRGEDMWTSCIYFLPTVAGKVLFDASPDDISVAGAFYWQATIKNLTIYGGNAIDKTAIRFWHVRGGNIDNVHVHFDTGCGDTSTGSIALNIMGTDETTISNSIFRAARPILAENQPTSDRNGLDHVTFENMTLYNEIGSHPLIEFQIETSQVAFKGRQTWDGGTSAFYSTGLDHSNLSFENVRWENAGITQNQHSFYLTGADTGASQPDSSNLVSIKDSRIGIQATYSAIYIRNFHTVLLESIEGSLSTVGVGYLYNVDGTNMSVTVINANHMIGEIIPLIGADLQLVLGIGGDESVNGYPFTRFYTSTKAFTGGVIGKPYVNIPVVWGGVAFKNGATTAGYIDLYEDSDDGTNFVRIMPPAMAATWILKPPAAVPGATSLLTMTIESAECGAMGYSSTAWRVFYNGAGGAFTELALGVDGTFLESNGAAAAPAFRALLAADIPDLSATYQPLDGTLTDIADGTIAENLVNTANPWADDEVADNITAGNASTVTTNANLTGAVTSVGNATTMSVRPAVVEHSYIFNIYNPHIAYAKDTHICIDPNTRSAMKITDIQVRCDDDPDAELDWDLYYADSFIGMANAALIHALDTTVGVFSSGTETLAVPAAKCVYIVFTAEPEAGMTQVSVKIIWDYD